MSNILKFPNQPDRESTFKAITEALNHSQYQKAITLLSQLYEEEPDFETIKQLLSILIVVQDCERLKTWWDRLIPGRALEDFPFDQDLADLYIESIPHIFDQKEALLEAYRLMPVLASRELSTAVLNQFVHGMNQFDRIVQQAEASRDTDQLLDQVMALVNQPPYQVDQLLSFFSAYPSDATQLLALAVLKHSEIFNLTKAKFSNYLIQQDFQENVSYFWFGHEYLVDFSQLEPIEESLTYQMSCHTIRDFTDREDPQMSAHILDYFHDYCLSLYPFLKENILPINEWLELIFTQDITSIQQSVDLDQVSIQEQYFLLANQEILQSLT